MNKLALITGGTRGIGKQIALTFAKEGYNIAINYRTENDDLKKTKKEVEANNVKCFAVQGDVTNFKDCEQFVKQIVEEFGNIDVLVNNAGITKDTLLMRMKEEDFKQVIDTNLVGTFNVTKNVITYMMKARNGRIINISSVVGISGNAGQTNYAASKAGLVSFSISLAREVAKYGINVNMVAPGMVRTPMTEEALKAKPDYYNGRIPIGRVAEPEEVAQAAVFLASKCADYYTGITFDATGGMLMR